MSARFVRLIAGLCLLLCCAGCSSFVKEPQVVVRKVAIVGLDTSGVDVEFQLTVTNPNMFDISLLGYSYDLKVLTLPLANGGRQETIQFPAGRDTDLLLPLRVNHSSLVNILKRRPDPDRIPYQLQALLSISTPAGEMSLPVEKNDTFSLPERYRPSVWLDRIIDSVKQFPR